MFGQSQCQALWYWIVLALAQQKPIEHTRVEVDWDLLVDLWVIFSKLRRMIIFSCLTVATTKWQSLLPQVSLVCTANMKKGGREPGMDFCQAGLRVLICKE